MVAPWERVMKPFIGWSMKGFFILWRGRSQQPEPTLATRDRARTKRGEDNAAL